MERPCNNKTHIYVKNKMIFDLKNPPPPVFSEQWFYTKSYQKKYNSYTFQKHPKRTTYQEEISEIIL